jgi:hypothetical protein
VHIHYSRDVSTSHHLSIGKYYPQLLRRKKQATIRGPVDLTGILFGKTSFDQVNAGSGLVQRLLNSMRKWRKKPSIMRKAYLCRVSCFALDSTSALCFR